MLENQAIRLKKRMKIAALWLYNTCSKTPLHWDEKKVDAWHQMPDIKHVIRVLKNSFSLVFMLPRKKCARQCEYVKFYGPF